MRDDLTVGALRQACREMEDEIAAAIAPAFGKFIERTGDAPQNVELNFTTHRISGDRVDRTLLVGVRVTPPELL